MLHLGENMKQRINHCTTANIAIFISNNQGDY